ncbi:MAG TPA: Crp/Fnr family transcriptional regulator [Deltaproteobacteria bacterium]|nr:Crp/Fnr family transcriptional regulator [Deltaproteobacteria bacterium]
MNMANSVRKDVVDSLRTIPLFRRVSEGDLEELASHLIERRFPKNATVVEEGLPGDYMYVIREGRAKVTKASEDGREKIMNFLEAGAFFGDMALLGDETRSASVKTLEESTLLALSRRDFIDLLRQSPDMALAVIEELANRLRETNEQARSLSFQGVEERTRNLFERIAQREEGGTRMLTPTLTHQQIADMVGTSRETVTRSIKQLKASGWLAQEGKRYVIPCDNDAQP